VLPQNYSHMLTDGFISFTMSSGIFAGFREISRKVKSFCTFALRFLDNGARLVERRENPAGHCKRETNLIMIVWCDVFELYHGLSKSPSQ
jgi:hypothetical protein